MGTRITCKFRVGDVPTGLVRTRQVNESGKEKEGNDKEREKRDTQTVKEKEKVRERNCESQGANHQEKQARGGERRMQAGAQSMYEPSILPQARDEGIK